MSYVSKNRHKFYLIGEANPDTIRKYIENQG